MRINWFWWFAFGHLSGLGSALFTEMSGHSILDVLF